jgi:hypothetical protein
MRVLIQDYSSPNSTEPMYLCQSFNSVGIQASLWNSDRMSAYDVFDSFQPNLFVAHFTKITSDCVKYLAQNQHIKSIINMTGAQQNHVEQLDDLLRKTGLNCQFIFTSTPKKMNKLKSSVVEVVELLAAADIFAAATQPKPEDFNVENCVITNYDSRSRLSSQLDGTSHHFISNSAELTEQLDITAPELNLQALYPNYKNVIISRDDQVIPQSLFSSIYHGANVFYKGKYETQAKVVMDSLQNIYRGIEGCFELGESFSHKKIREETVRKHTCFNRTQKICAKLEWQEIKQRFDEKIGELQ